MTISRRDMLKTTATAAAGAVALPGLAKVTPKLTQSAAPKFFTAAEFALADELTDMIIPTDQQSGGARAAGVALYIDGRLAESFEKDVPQRWRAGLKAVDALSREMNGGKAFMDAAPEQRLAVLTKMAAAEADPKTDAEKFFRDLKGSTVQAYYTSKVGIHDDQQYKGNVYQTGEYAGFDPT